MVSVDFEGKQSCPYAPEHDMRTVLFVIFSVLIPAQAFAQKEPREYPWERAARRIEADQAKMAQSKKNENLRETGARKPETKSGETNKKGK